MHGSSVPAEIPIELYFYSEDDVANASGLPSMKMERLMPTEDYSPDALLKLLFDGPNDEEYAKGARTFSALEELKDYYIGVGLDDDVLVVDFTSKALQYLNGAAAMQGMVKTPIEMTLMQFPEIREVQYSINGEVFDEWDA